MPDPTLAVYLAMDSRASKAVLAAWEFCVAAGKNSTRDVSRVAGISDSVADLEIERLRVLGLLTDDGISEWARTIIAKEVIQKYGTKGGDKVAADRKTSAAKTKPAVSDGSPDGGPKEVDPA